MLSDRSLILIIVCCLTAVWLAAAIKVNITGIGTVTKAPFSMVMHQTSVTDPGFYDKEIVKDPKPTTATTSVKPHGLPGVSARAYLVGNPKTGKIYLEYNSRLVLPVASMSKLVTAFVATDLMKVDKIIPITKESLNAPPDRSNLMEGEKFTLSEALLPLLLSSSNITAEAIASSSDRASFMESMKSYAWEVGMPNSFFADPSGVSSRNVASARDLLGLSKYLIDFRPDILTITRTGTTTMATTTEHGSHIIVSTHPFVSDPRFIGGKTGRTPEAGETMLTIMDIGGKPIAIIVLGSSYGGRQGDTKLLLDKALPIIAKDIP